jgi:hypothetical protein
MASGAREARWEEEGSGCVMRALRRGMALQAAAGGRRAGGSGDAPGAPCSSLLLLAARAPPPPVDPAPHQHARRRSSSRPAESVRTAHRRSLLPGPEPPRSRPRRLTKPPRS